MFLGFYLVWDRTRFKSVLGNHVSVIGDFIDIGNSESVYQRLNYVGNDDCVPFLNVLIGNKKEVVPNLSSIASGSVDGAIIKYAQEIGKYNKEVFIILAPEMNGSWTENKYGTRNQETFKQAYRKFVDIFKQHTDPNKVQFIFAPNGWSEYEHRFETYYPGDDYVDGVGLSLYGFGFCDDTVESYSNIVGQYVDRAVVMTVGKKPIYFSQFGKLSESISCQDSQESIDYKFNWTKSILSEAVQNKNIKGIVYFNSFEDKCGGVADYRIIYDNLAPTGIADSSFTSLLSSDLISLFERRNRRFNDVSPFHPSISEEYIHDVCDLGIMYGTSTNPPLFNPDGVITRAAMCVIALRVKRGSSYSPPTPITSTGFSDVPLSHWAAIWIKQAVMDGIISGFPDGTFKPDNPVTRAQFSVMFLKARFGSSYSPIPAMGKFIDCPITFWASAWIENLCRKIGYNQLYFYPNSNLIRKDSAEWIVKGL